MAGRGALANHHSGNAAEWRLAMSQSVEKFLSETIGQKTVSTVEVR